MVISKDDWIDIQSKLKTLLLYTGKIDGDPGPKTQGAIKAFQLAKGLSPDGIVGPKTLSALGINMTEVPITKNLWPQDATEDLTAFYTDPDGSAKWEVTNLVYVHFPWTAYLAGTKNVLSRGVRVHKKCEKSFKHILDYIWKELAQESQAEIVKMGLDQVGGAYLYRVRRGSGRKSLHAYGAAIDLDPEHNQMRKGNRGIMQARVIAAFEMEGWRWGGNYGDPMHFEAVDNGKPMPTVRVPYTKMVGSVQVNPVAVAPSKAAVDSFDQTIICNEAVALIKRWESFVPKGYDDRGHQAIGYGHTGKLGTEPKIITSEMTITEIEADKILRNDLAHLDETVDPLIIRQLTDNQYGAVLSFVYNVGLSNFKNSTLLRKLNLGEWQAAADEFLKWDKSTNPKTGVKEKLAGLSKRRASERDLFLKP